MASASDLMARTRPTRWCTTLTDEAQSCGPNDPVGAVSQQIGDAPRHRLAVPDTGHTIIGIVALTDPAASRKVPVSAVLREISGRKPAA